MAARVNIEVPGTLANLGAGYDAVGLAIEIVNHFEVSVVSEATHPPDLVEITAQRAAARFGGSLPRLKIEQIEGVPRARGMGSSATARVAGLLAYEAILQQPLDEPDRVAFLVAEEGHPDNVLPALYGGLVLSGSPPKCLQVAPVQIAVCIPAKEVPTPAARAALPDSVSHSSAVFNVIAVAQLVAGLLDGDMVALRQGTQDRLHQSFRAHLIGPIEESFSMAYALGAAPFVGGSGSTLAAFVSEGGPAVLVAEALAAPFQAKGIPCRTLVCGARSAGATTQRTG